MSNCKEPGMAHRARNCSQSGCASAGECIGIKPPLTAAVVETEIKNRESVPFQTADKSHIPQTLPVTKSALPTDKQARKDTPITSGVLDYFTAAIAEIARVSKAGNDQHNPGQPLHWARGKSMDHADCIVRHLIERGTIDEDGMRHSAKMAWRALALLQQELEDEGAPMSRASKLV